MNALAASAITKVPSTIGKQVYTRLYVHSSAIELLPPEDRDAMMRALTQAALGADQFNVIRLEQASGTVTFLYYPHFFEHGCPSLSESWKVRLDPSGVAHRIYTESLNPPILHRKELLLAGNHPDRPRFEKLTAELEALGAFKDPARIGFRLQWERLLSERGFRIVGHDLIPIGNDESESDPEVVSDQDPSVPIARHLTALARQSLSAPIQILSRFGFLDGTMTLFDYGCGRGGDLRGLTAANIPATGWDPYFSPQTAIEAADLVNLGFVINVIEDPVERREALLQAYDLAKVLLVVSTMIASEESITGTPFADGVLTRRRTFQKYYTQPELLQYVGHVLGEAPIPVAPGICFIFRDKQAEQRFLLGRHRSRLRVRPTRLRVDYSNCSLVPERVRGPRVPNRALARPPRSVVQTKPISRLRSSMV